MFPLSQLSERRVYYLPYSHEKWEEPFGLNVRKSFYSRTLISATEDKVAVADEWQQNYNLPNPHKLRKAPQPTAPYMQSMCELIPHTDSTYN